MSQTKLYNNSTTLISYHAFEASVISSSLNIFVVNVTFCAFLLVTKQQQSSQRFASLHKENNVPHNVPVSPDLSPVPWNEK